VNIPDKATRELSSGIVNQTRGGGKNSVRQVNAEETSFKFRMVGKKWNFPYSEFNTITWSRSSTTPVRNAGRDLAQQAPSR
jgi:hypothetical protein